MSLSQNGEPGPEELEERVNHSCGLSNFRVRSGRNFDMDNSINCKCNKALSIKFHQIILLDPIEV